MTRIEHPTVEERIAQGKEARTSVPPSSHGAWEEHGDRADPIALLEEQNTTREPDLVPVRHGRMMVSPFTFYRGAAKIMAADLANTPTTDLTVQLCGDAHLSNFGLYASPERDLVFDLNDFDETLPGPFEYDVKRLAASVAVAGRNNAFRPAEIDDATRACVASYREAMVHFAGLPTMQVWYDRFSERDFTSFIRTAALRHMGRTGKKVETTAGLKRAKKTTEKARTRDSLQALSKLAEHVDGAYRIVNQPPIIMPLTDVAAAVGVSADQIEHLVREQFRAYRATLQDDRRQLLERFRVVDVARKVVGVGSVGTRNFIVLLQGRDEQDPLFLQVKEASASVLEDHLPKSVYHQPGERVVHGQRLMQAASDIFLGWTKGAEDNRYHYWRQLRDMKGSAEIETMSPGDLALYAGLCGHTLARAHARSGDPIALAAYLGKKDRFDQALVEFSTRYADQNERDFQAFTEAIRSGRLPVLEGV